jgi:transcriptional regulator with XRE-family HTH domain
MSSDILSRLLEGLKLAGVERGSRNRVVAEKTGYSEGSVNRILSGNTKLTGRFLQSACTAFGISKTWVESGEQGTFFTGDVGLIHGTSMEIDWVEPTVTGSTTEAIQVESPRFARRPTRTELTREAIQEIEKMPVQILRHVVSMLKELNAGINK